MNKADFERLMQRWSALEIKMRELDETTQRLFNTTLSEFMFEYDDLICDAIATGVGDKDEWVSYFAYERYFDLSEPCVEDANGNEIPTSTWEDVYDLIVDGADHEDNTVEELKIAVETLNSTVDELNYELDMSDDIIRELYSARPRWISVKDELPEIRDHDIQSDMVIISDGKHFDVGAYFDGLGMKGWCFSARLTKVTHWMPMQELPKEGADG